MYASLVDAEEAELAYRKKLTKEAKGNGYGCCLEEHELIEEQPDDSSDSEQSADRVQ